jgi:hypothetical protein
VSDETDPEVPQPRHLHLLLAVLVALALGFAAGRLTGDAMPTGPAGLAEARTPPRDGSPVVAEVAGQILSLDQFLARWERLPLETQRFHLQRGGPEHYLDEVGEELLLSQEAVDRGYAAETAPRELVRRDVNRALVRPLLADEVRAKAVPERELQSRFELRRSEWERPARVRVREIRITAEPAPPGLDAEDDASSPEEAEAKVRSLHGRLLAGESFEELAERYSEAPSARYQGLIGWVVQGRLALEYEESAFSLAVGELSAPLPMEDGGWVILRAEDRQEAGVVSFEDHREELLKDLLEEDPGAVSRRYRVFVEELKRSHGYRVEPGLVRDAFEGAKQGKLSR